LQQAESLKKTIRKRWSSGKTERTFSLEELAAVRDRFLALAAEGWDLAGQVDKSSKWAVFKTDDDRPRPRWSSSLNPD
jgi:hypothetical protein